LVGRSTGDKTCLDLLDRSIVFHKRFDLHLRNYTPFSYLARSPVRWSERRVTDRTSPARLLFSTFFPFYHPRSPFFCLLDCANLPAIPRTPSSSNQVLFFSRIALPLPTPISGDLRYLTSIRLDGTPELSPFPLISSQGIPWGPLPPFPESFPLLTSPLNLLVSFLPVLNFVASPIFAPGMSSSRISPHLRRPAALQILRERTTALQLFSVDPPFPSGRFL